MKYKASNTKIQHKMNRDNYNPGLDAFYEIWPGNTVKLLSKEKIKKK